jgi:hypothetical protein
MQYINLLIDRNEDTSLDTFARSFFAAVGGKNFEERESSNYVEGRYFVGQLNGMHFEIALSDLEGFADLNYWISIEATAGFAKHSLFALYVDEIVKNKLIPSGFRVAKIVDFGKRDMQRIDY